MEANVTYTELQRGAAALHYALTHGNEIVLKERVGLAIEERRDRQRADGWNRDRVADFIGWELSRLTKLSQDDCTAAAKEALSGSYARAVLDEIVAYASELRREQSKQPQRQGSLR
jgi:hypothetical protein